MKNKIIKIILIIFVILNSTTSFFLKAQNTSYWDGSSASVWTNGSGSIGMPYLIENATHLAYLANSVNTGNNYDGIYFKLMTNMNLGAGLWTPIGISTSNFFSGYFDGNNYNIDSVRVDVTATATSFGGLFGVLKNSKVHNLTLSNVNISLKSVSAAIYAGGLAGAVLGDDIVQYCDVVSGSVYSISDAGGKAYAGGVLGYTQITTNSIRIKNCTNAAFVKGNYTTGGIIGSLNTTQTAYDTIWISSCSNSGLIYGAPTPTNIYTGGIIGWINAARDNTQCYIDNCSNTAKVKDSICEGNYIYTGGIVGYLQNASTGTTNINVTITNSWNSGDIDNINSSKSLNTDNWSYAAGVIGNVTLYGVATIQCFNLYNSGKVNLYRSSTLTLARVGGIVGLLSTQEVGSSISLSQIYNSGNVSLFYSDTADVYTSAGGILGWIYNSKGNCTIDKCLNTGNITNDSYYSGGIIGYLNGLNASSTTTINNCFNSGDMQSINTVGGIIGCYHGQSGSTCHLNYCISAGTPINTINTSAIATLEQNTSLDIATCYYDRQITACDSGCCYIGTGALAINDTVRHARQLVDLKLDPTVWYMENNMYPRLLCFKDVDAAILGATPIFFYANPGKDFYNTVNKVDRPLNFAGIIGTHFHSSAPSLLTIVNNDSASVNTTTDEKVILTASYGTANKRIELTLKPKPVIDLIIDKHLCSNELPFNYENKFIITEQNTYYYYVSSIHDADTSFTINVIVNQAYDTLVVEFVNDKDFPYKFNEKYLTEGGIYTEKFETKNGCDSIVHLVLIPETYTISLSICGVSVNEDNHNVIEWEKTNNRIIKEYYIYRENDISNSYTLIGTVPYDSASIYVDKSVNPSKKAYRYKIKALTIYGYKTDDSPHHQTIHLTINKGINNMWNLIWTHYEGVAYNSYKIYRGSTKNNMNYLTEIAGHLNSYTDEVAGTEYYYVEIAPLNACNSFQNAASPYLKSNNSMFIKSNTVVNDASNIALYDKDKQVIISPNPAQDYIDIRWDNDLIINELVIYDMCGKILKVVSLDKSKRLDISYLVNGFYILQLKNNHQVIGNYKILKTY